jgi:MFS family permease
MPREVWALLFVRFVVSAGGFVMPFLAMLLSIKLGYDDAKAGAFMFVGTLLAASGLLLGGKLGDTIGRRRTLITLQIASAIAFLACAALGFRPLLPIVVGIALAALNGTWPCINAVVADVAPPEHVKTAFSLLYWGNNIGFSVGPLIGGYLFAVAPRALFLGNALALILAAVVVILFVPEPRRQVEVTQGEDEDRDISTFAALRREPVLALYAGLCILSAFVYAQHTFALPYFLKDLLGEVQGPKAFGTVMAVNGITVVLFTVPMALLTKRVPTLMGIVLSSLIYIVGFGAYTFATGLPFILGATAFWTLGEILGATNGNAFVAERAAPSHRARINAAISGCYIAGSALAPLAAGLITRTYGTRAVWVPVAGVAALTTLGYLALYRFDQRRGAAR